MFPGWALGLWLLAGCQTYTPKPLDPDAILEQVDEERRAAAEGEVLSLAQATALMRTHAPRLKELRAAHAGARAFADTPTPLPNPVVEVAPTYTNLVSEHYGVDAALGWAVFLTGRRRLTDERNALVADAAAVDLAAAEREEYLGLRRDYLALALAARTVAARRELEDTVATSLAIMQRLVEAAQATALDVRELELEAFGAQAAVLGAGEAETEARSALAARTGVPARAFPGLDLPPLPPDLAPEGEVRAAMLRGSPELARLRAEYAVAEKELRLEIARQFPSLDLGLLYEREDGANKYGIGIGIEVPLFDRNQPAIAQARARREELRVRFEAEVARRLAAIEAASARLDARRARLALLRDQAAPAAADALALARRGLQSGAGDALRFLSVLRAERAMRVELLAAEEQVYMAWSDLEEACGAPLLRFATEPGEER